MTARLRPVLADLPAYVPGRTVPGAIKLASNETGYDLLPEVAERVATALTHANRYPDNASVRLTEALAARHGVDPKQVAVGCGSVSLCQQLANITVDSGDEVLFAWRSFEAYPIVAAIAGGRSVRVPVTATAEHDLDAMADAITDRTRLVFVCSPNNPTGPAIRTDTLRAFLDRVPEDITVVLDEAYHEFVRDPEVPDGTKLIADYENLIVLRTFSKAYSLAGLRVGYGVAADDRITSALKQVQAPFAVSDVAQEAALASLEPAVEQQLMARVDEIVAERTRVVNALRTQGYPIPDTQANFLWLPLGAQASAFAAACEERKLIVRAFAPDGIRITIGRPEENDLLIAAAAEIAGTFATG